jgi:hypothetical protein
VKEHVGRDDVIGCFVTNCEFVCCKEVRGGRKMERKEVMDTRRVRDKWRTKGRKGGRQMEGEKCERKINLYCSRRF